MPEGGRNSVTRFVCGHSARPHWRPACDECVEQVSAGTASVGPGTDSRDQELPGGLSGGLPGSREGLAAGRIAGSANVSLAKPEPASERLGFVYVTDAFGPSLGAVVNYLRERTSIDHWVGSVGLGICAPGVEYFGVPAIAVMVATLPAGAFRVFDGISSDFGTFEAIHQDWCNAQSPYFAVVHGDPQNAAMPDLIEGLASRIGDGYLTGGLASAETAMVQVADGLTSGGLSGVLISPKIPVATRLSQGCTPIGPRHQITRAERNIIIELDGRPALEVFNEDIGEILARDLRRAAGYIFAALPIVGSDTGDYLVRNLIGVDPRTGVIAIGEGIESGQKVMFCRRDAQSAASDMTRMLSELEQSLSTTPKGGLYFSCLARGPNLFGPNSEEVAMIREVFGDLPMVGFFANGEISHNRLYTYTGVLTLFT